MFQTISTILLAFIITTFIIHLLRPVAIKLELMDMAGGRKQHAGDVPLIGGMAIFVGFLFALLTLNISLLDFRPLLAGAGLLVLIGVLDDFHELSPRSRLFAQIIAAAIMIVWGGNYVRSFGDLLNFGDIILGHAAWIVTIFAVVGIINAVNMTDGLDGLAGGLAFIQLSLMAYISFHAGFTNNFHVLILILATLLGFLMFNFPVWPKKQASVFLGDAGSMLLGFILVWFAISLTQAPHAAVSPVTMLWVLMLPLFDLVASIIRRLLKKQSMFQADRGHFHHIFQMAGYKKSTVTYIMCTLSLMISVFGLLMNYHHVPEWLMFAVFLILFALYYWALAHAWRFMKFVKLRLARRKKMEERVNVS